VPAEPSGLAARTLLNGLARAGDRLVAVGQRGHALYSDDQGRTWIQASVPVSADLVAVTFPTAARGWAVGHDGVVLHSADRGVTWTRQLTGPAAEALGPDRSLLDVWFEDDASGFVVGAFNLVLHTADGGRTWERWSDRTENPEQLHLYAVRGVAGEVFVAGEKGLLLRLDRAAGRFRRLASPYPGTLFGLTGTPTAVIAFGLRGTVLRSTDRGATWRPVWTGSRLALTAGAVTEDRRLVLVTQEGHVLVSTDDGASFSTLPLERLAPASAVAAAGRGALALAGALGVSTQAVGTLSR
jgi:photosystem II stability/assembly factor-like uncharacterized protein